MRPDTDLLFALLALQSNLLSRERLLEAADTWMNAPGESFAAVIEARGFLSHDKAAELSAIVAGRLHGSIATGQAGRESQKTPPPAAAGRYQLMAELGRGGLGRVVEAFDSALRRDVAVKLLHYQEPGDAPERFAREARLAAKLEHPAIIPVYDFGTMTTSEGAGQVYLAMKRVRGRDLEQVIRTLAEGQVGARRTWTRGRLLRVFQDVCLGMAFAHDRGVIHRDLKPSNIMIGDYGETLIVDWGLAKELKDAIEGEAVPGTGPAASAPASRPAAPPAKRPGTTVRLTGGTSRAKRTESDYVALSRAPNLTFEGDIIGTPAYMSPEQAEGRVDDVDARSDIYALGAILYEILALRPPFEGGSVEEVITRVRDGTVTPPSKALVTRSQDLSPPSSTTHAGDPVPPELDVICLRALARKPGERFQTARELHDELQLFLEGVKRRERQRAEADAAVDQVRKALARRMKLRGEASIAKEEAKRLEATTPPLGDKAALWAAEDRAAELGRQAATAHADAVSALTRALEHDREHADARAMMADLAWESFVEAEEAGEEAAALVHRRVAEEHNDGRLQAQLRGEGTLAVKTSAFSCDCLTRGRTVFPEELAAGEWHTYSGRSMKGTPGAEGLPAFEPKSASRLRVHGATCAANDLAGSDVWLFRHEDIGRRLIPVTPPTTEEGPAVPAAVLDALFAKDSAFRPQGPGLHLGRTPIIRRAFPMGSYLLIVVREGRAPARVPLFVPRGGHVDQHITLFKPAEVPDGFAPVAEGAFGFQGDRENPYAGPAETRDLPAFFLARHPVTCREYAEFLNALPKEEAARRAPREAPDAPPLWSGPPWSIAGARRLPNVTVDWQDDWPVAGVSWEDAVAFANWKRTRDGVLVTLPTSFQWEKAARGPDRRFYPWGRHLDPRWTNGERSHEGAPRPVPVSSFPDDESPYGIRDLAGNTRDACLDDAGSDWPGRRQFRGGTWARPAIEMRASDRTAMGAKLVVFDFGFRVAVMTRLPEKSHAKA